MFRLRVVQGRQQNQLIGLIILLFLQMAASNETKVRRWSFAERQKEKGKRKEKVDTGTRKTELFVMLPMDTISVGELQEGQEVSFINSPSLNAALLDKRFSVLRAAGVQGVMLDVW